MSVTVSSHWGESFTGALLELMWRGLPWAMLYAGLGLVIALTVIVLIAKLGLLRRRLPVWNALAKLSYIVILAGMVLAFSGFGVVRHLHQEAAAICETRVFPQLREQAAALVRVATVELEERLALQPEKIPAAMRALFGPLYYRAASHGVLDQTTEFIVNSLVDKIGGKALARMVDEARRGGEKVRWEKELPTLIIEGARQQLDGVFRIFYQFVIMLWLGCAAIVAGEMLLYFGWYERRKRFANVEKYV